MRGADSDDPRLRPALRPGASNLDDDEDTRTARTADTILARRRGKLSAHDKTTTVDSFGWPDGP